MMMIPFLKICYITSKKKNKFYYLPCVETTENDILLNLLDDYISLFYNYLFGKGQINCIKGYSC